MADKKREVDQAHEAAETVRPMPIWVWILVPLAVIIGFELSIQDTGITFNMGWHTVDDVANAKKIDYLFVGTSRTLAAVDEATFTDEIWQQTGQGLYGQNMGVGGVRLVWHYLGLRNLYQQAQDDPQLRQQLQGTTVLIEAPGELPEHMYWTDNWVYPTYEQLLIPNLRSRDLGPLWSSTMPLNLKIDLTLRFLFHDWDTFTFRGRIRHEFIRHGGMMVERLLAAVTGIERGEDEKIQDLNFRGNIKGDPDVARNAERLLAEWKFREQKKLQRAWRNWEETILADIVKTVQQGGGDVAFYDIPQPSGFDDIYHTEQRNADRRAFYKAAEKWGTPVLKPDFEYTDDDFPDHFHLSGSESMPYSRALARAFVREVMEEAMEPQQPEATNPSS